MFNRYWRTYPWGLQLTLFMLMIFTLMSFALYLTLVFVPRVTGVTMTDIQNLSEHSSTHIARISLIVTACITIGTFAAPALLFSSFTHPRIREYLRLRLPGKGMQWLLVTGIMLGLIPVLLWGETWMMHHIHLGADALKQQEKTDGMFKAFLNLRSTGDFLSLLLVLALLPAVSEELAFRGVFLRLFHRGFKRRLIPLALKQPAEPDSQRSMVFPVICSALLFAYWHSSPYGFVFIFFAGCVLALIYNLTGSLLCSFWAHFIYNGSQIALVFFSRQSEVARKIAEGENFPVIYPLIGIIVFISCFYALVKNQTPLPANWSADFSDKDIPANQGVN